MTRARDIIDAISQIKTYVAGMDEGAYASDRKTQDAVERQLEKISEACTRIRRLEEVDGIATRKRLETAFPKIRWDQIRALGNLLRHEYGRADATLIWNIVAESDDLDKLEKAIRTSYPQIPAP